MELPKNVTQIGESDRNCKIYVEDYVISYVKQVNHLAENKDMAVALYGTRKEENNIAYLFFYGACKLDFLQREVRHLSQAQSQEIEKLRQKYFKEYQFLGYRLLNGEMVEGFHICEQDICRYIKGYACFYEKNDGMLAYMLDTRQEENKPEEVDQEKYDRVKQRQEERRQQHEEELRPRMEKKEERPKQEEKRRTESTAHTERTARTERARSAPNAKPPLTSANLKTMRASVVSVFALLCILGMASLSSNGKIGNLKETVGDFFRDFTEKKLPDTDGALEAMNPSVQPDTLIAEDKLTDAIRQENSGQNSAAEGDESQVDNTSGTDAVGQGGSAEGSTTPGTVATGDGSAIGAGQAGNGTDTSAANGTVDTGAGQPSDPAQNVAADSGTQGGTALGTDQGTTTPESTLPDTTTAEGGTANGSGQSDVAEAVTAPQTPAPVSYTIQSGDTLIGISLRNYGSESKVKEICSLNNITNPDNIKMGQKILLP